jgi:hypothetical protein
VHKLDTAGAQLCRLDITHPVSTQWLPQHAPDLQAVKEVQDEADKNTALQTKLETAA